jgi:Ca2+-binding RTX toxin-like protein
MRGGPGDDTIGDAPDPGFFLPVTGNDTVDGGAGNDDIHGSLGADHILAGAGMTVSLATTATMCWSAAQGQTAPTGADMIKAISAWPNAGTDANADLSGPQPATGQGCDPGRLHTIPAAV